MTADDLSPARWLSDGATVWARAWVDGGVFWVKCRVTTAFGDGAVVESAVPSVRLSGLRDLRELRVRRDSPMATGSAGA